MKDVRDTPEQAKDKLVARLYEQCNHGGETCRRWQCVTCRNTIILDVLRAAIHQTAREDAKLVCRRCRKGYGVPNKNGLHIPTQIDRLIGGTEQYDWNCQATAIFKAHSLDE